MKNQNSWKPTVFIVKNGKWRASRDPQEVHVGSRLVNDLTAVLYAEHLRAHSKGRLLDLGCGAVPLYAFYKGGITENVCVDWAKSLHQGDHLDHEMDLTRDLSFPDQSFDTILCSQVLEHIPNPQHLWAEMSRLLRPGGKLILSVPFLYWIHEEPHDYHRYTEFALRKFAEESGMKVLLLEATGGVFEVMTDISAKLTAHVPLIGPLLSHLMQVLCFWFVNLKFGKNLSKKTSKKFPLGYFLVAEKP